ncbi:major facilitator superfamily domain-containing protein [Aspergillus californicus]
MPVVWVLYMFNYLDRNNIAQARFNNFERDFNMHGTNFNVAVYMLAQLPSNMVLTRSCVSAATAGVHNFSGSIAVRFLLGIVEAPVFPGAFYILSGWYTRKELALRTAVLYSGLILATAFSGLIAAGIFAGLEGARGLIGWHWRFIIEGAGSFLAAIVAMALLPDYTHSKSGNNDRVSVADAERSIWVSVKLAVGDYRTWMFFVMLCSNHTAYGFNNFFPYIVRGFNLGSNTITLVLTAPPYLFAAVISFIVAYSSDRNNERGFHIASPMCVAIIGFIISVSFLNVPARYRLVPLRIRLIRRKCNGLFLGSVCPEQTPEKRAAATAILDLLAQFGNIWSPYLFSRAGDEPRYVMAVKADLKRENRKLLEEGAVGGRVTLYPV